MIFVLKYRRMFLGGALVLAFFLGAYLIWSSIYQSGYDARVLEEQQAIAEASNIARARIVETEKKYDEIITEIQNTDSTNDCVGDSMRLVLDRL